MPEPLDTETSCLFFWAVDISSATSLPRLFNIVCERPAPKYIFWVYHLPLTIHKMKADLEYAIVNLKSPNLYT